MLFTGTHPRTLDDKKRVALPKRVREQLGEASELYVTPGPDQCLWIFRKEDLESLAAKLDEAPATDTQVRVFRRLFFAQMEGVAIDRSGRILVPERLLAFGNLQHDVVLIGVRDHLELWNAERWNEYLAQHGPAFDSFAEGAFQNKK